MLVEDNKEVVGVLFANIFDGKFVDYEEKLHKLPGVTSEARRSRGFVVASGIEALAEEVAYELPGLW